MRGTTRVFTGWWACRRQWAACLAAFALSSAHAAVQTAKIDTGTVEGVSAHGITAFKEAAAGFMKKVFGVSLNPETEINHAIGSKPALAMIPAAFINPGDITLMIPASVALSIMATNERGGVPHVDSEFGGFRAPAPSGRHRRPADCRPG